MSPTFKEHEIVLVNRLAFLLRSPKVNEIIILKDPRTKREIIKRVTKIRKNMYFVEGDNKKESTDSRIFGEIPRSAIIGKVLFLS